MTDIPQLLSKPSPDKRVGKDEYTREEDTPLNSSSKADLMHSALQRKVRSLGEVKESLENNLPTLHASDWFSVSLNAISIVINTTFITYGIFYLERNADTHLGLTKYIEFS